MSETESYYTSLSEIKWFSCYLPNRNTPDTWQINASNRPGNTADWEASVSESKPAYEAPLLFTGRPTLVLALN